MALYTNCSIRVKLPANYTKKDELTKVLESEFVGCEMNFEESTTDNEPYVQEVIVPESTQLGSLRASEWAPLGGTAPNSWKLSAEQTGVKGDAKRSGGQSRSRLRNRGE